MLNEIKDTQTLELGFNYLLQKEETERLKLEELQ